MGELLDRLNEMDPRPHAPGEPMKSLADHVAGAFRSASERVNETIEAVQRSGMPSTRLAVGPARRRCRRWLRRSWSV
jgi:hypothetical protein